MTLPWKTPITELFGQNLGIVLGVRTELSVVGAKPAGTGSWSPAPSSTPPNFKAGRPE